MPAPAHPSKAPEVSAADLQVRKEQLEQIQQYFNANGVNTVVDEVINQVATDLPVDCYGTLSKLFGKRGKYAVCSDVKFLRGLDADGDDSVTVLVLADFRGNKLSGRGFLPYAFFSSMEDKPETKKPQTAASQAGDPKLDPNEIIRKVEAAVNSIVKGCDITTVDELLTNATEKIDLNVRLESQLVTTISLACSSIIAQCEFERCNGLVITHPFIRPLSAFDPLKFRFVIPVFSGNARIKAKDISLIVNPNDFSLSEILTEMESLQQALASAVETGSKGKDKKQATADMNPKDIAYAQAYGLAIPGAQFANLKDLFATIKEVVGKEKRKFRFALRFDPTVIYDQEADVYSVNDGEKLKPEEYVTMIRNLGNETPELQIVENFLSEKTPKAFEVVGKSFKYMEPHFTSTEIFPSKRLTVDLLKAVTLSKVKSSVKAVQHDSILIDSIPSDIDSHNYFDLAVSLGADYLRIGWPSKRENVKAYQRFYELAALVKP